MWRSTRRLQLSYFHKFNLLRAGSAICSRTRRPCLVFQFDPAKLIVDKGCISHPMGFQLHKKLSETMQNKEQNANQSPKDCKGPQGMHHQILQQHKVDPLPPPLMSLQGCGLNVDRKVITMPLFSVTSLRATLPMFHPANVLPYQCSALPMFRPTNVPPCQFSALPMFHTTNVPPLLTPVTLWAVSPSL